MSMPPNNSVTEWVEALRRNDEQAAQKLWERYFQRLVRLARGHLRKVPPRGAYNEEDVAVSAFFDVCQAMRTGKLAELQGRDELWSLLTTVTLRKARARLRRDGAQKRSARRTIGENDLEGDEQLDAITATEIGPDLQVLTADYYQSLLELLQDENLKQTAILKLAGYTNEEIALHLGCARRSVQRKLKLIRTTWETELLTSD